MRIAPRRLSLPPSAAWQGPASIVLVLLLSVMLASCGGGGSSGDDGSTGGGGTPTRRDQPANIEGRLLASNCFQCHGTGGTGGFESIRGSEADEVSKYRNLAGRPARADIMAAHAQGYTDAQIAAAIRYLQQ